MPKQCVQWWIEVYMNYVQLTTDVLEEAILIWHSNHDNQ